MRLINSPRSIYIAITSKCNLKCKYCAYFNSPQDVKKELPLSNWLEFFEKLREENVMRVVISGGEPFLREDIKEIIIGIIKNRMRFSILSNGTVCDEELFKFISSLERCDYIQISLDAHKPEINDKMRGEGSFAKIVNTIEVLKKYKIPITVRVTIHPENVYYLKEIAKFLLEDLNLNSFSTNSTDYIGLCIKNSKETQLNIEEYNFALKTFFELDKVYKNRIIANSGPLAFLRIWLSIQKGCINEIKGGYLLGCGGVFSSLAVRADGIITPCPLLSHIELGRIDDSLKDIWKENLELAEIRNRIKIPLNSFEYCRDCIYINYCTGGCPAIAYTNFGSINAPNTKDCLKYFLENGGKFPLDAG